MIKDRDVWDIKRVLVHQNSERRLVVTAGLCVGPYSPHWTVTAEEWNSYCTDDCSACGCLHKEILEAFPELKPVVDVHLAEPDGVPMHAVANAVYHLEQGEQEKLYRHLRWSDSDIARLNAGYGTEYESLWQLLEELERDSVLCPEDVKPHDQLTRSVENLINSVFKPMWAEQVAEARRVLEELPEKAVPPTPFKQAIDRLKIRMTVVNEEWDSDANQTKYIVRLRKGRKSMTVPFRVGAAHTGVAVDEVLGCCLRDAQDAENAGSFEDFCSSLGFDEDSRSAKRVYDACVTMGEKLQKFLGDDYDKVATPEM